MSINLKLAYMRQWRLKNKVKIKRYMKKYRLLNKARIRKIGNEYVKRNRTKIRTKHLVYSRKYYATHKKVHKQRVKSWEKRFPKAIKAHGIIKQLQRKNKIKYGACEVCKTRNAMDAHHPDYNKPLDIILVCRICHKAIHRETKNVK